MLGRHESDYKVGECGKVKSKNSDEFDLLSLRYNFLECGGTIEEFERMSVGEVLDFIHTYINMRSKTTKQNNKQQQKQNTSQGEKETYGVDPETLARWAREEEEAMG